MGYSATGRATYLLDEAGMAALTLSADFTVPDVPRVSIFLSNSPDLELAVKVGELQTRTGAQRWTFRVPRGAVWSWTVLWSEELWVEVGWRERGCNPRARCMIRMYYVAAGPPWGLGRRVRRTAGPRSRR